MSEIYEILSPGGHEAMTEQIFTYVKTYIDTHGPGSKVDRAGDTMTGALNMSDAKIFVKDTDINTDTNPSSDVWGKGYYLTCDDDVSVGYFRAVKDTDGKQGIQIETNRTISGTRYTNCLNLRIANDGTNIVEVSNPAVWRTALGLGSMATQSSSSYVAKTGDTMNGVLYNTSNFYAKRTGFTINTSSNNGVTTNQQGDLGVCGNDNGMAGRIAVVVGTDGSVTNYLQARNMKTDGTSVWNELKLIIKKDGTRSIGISDSSIWRSAIGCPAMASDSYPTILPTNGSNGWIKFGTANSSYGILPSQTGTYGSGHNNIGTSSWYWANAYVDNVYSCKGVFAATQDASGTADNRPALIVGGTVSQAHIEMDSNEIMAKANATSTAPLYINNDGGAVFINGGYAAKWHTTPTKSCIPHTYDAVGALVSTGSANMMGGSIDFIATNISSYMSGSNTGWSNASINMYDNTQSNRAAFMNWNKDSNSQLHLAISAQYNQNYNTISIYANQNGSCTYSVSSAANFRSAIGAAASSSRLTKTNIQDMTYEEASKIFDINVVSFDYKDGFVNPTDVKEKYYGVIAEDVEDEIPYVVNIPENYNEEDFNEEDGLNQNLIMVDYVNFVPYLLKVIQNQEQRIKALENK